MSTEIEQLERVITALEYERDQYRDSLENPDEEDEDWYDTRESLETFVETVCIKIDFFVKLIDKIRNNQVTQKDKYYLHEEIINTRSQEWADLFTNIINNY
ncbi:MAG: hypothetical protein ACKPCP_36425 [Sphaerospermopsis kisseleviana]